MNRASHSGLSKAGRANAKRWFWRLVGRFAAWVHDGEPVWYMHRQWTLEGRFLNWLANLNERAKSRLLWLDVADIRADLRTQIAKECGRFSPNSHAEERT